MIKKSGIFFVLLFSVGVLRAMPEKPIVVIVPSYNNAQWYKKNLDSIFMQQYDNYRVVYIDDCSSDGTGNLVRDYIITRGQEARVWLQCNEERIGALANIYHAVHRCNSEEIVVTADGDDWLSDELVLQRVNEVYADPQVWMTYGQYKEYPAQTIGSCKQIPAAIVSRNAYREYDWLSSHLRTFYAGLFQQIKLEDLLYKGRFFEVTWDMAFMFPMLEMAGEHARCISEVQYIYNQANVLNDFKQKLIDQIHCNHYIRSRPKYTPLASRHQISYEKTVSMILVSHDKEWLEAFLREDVPCIAHLSAIELLYDTSDRGAEAYERLVPVAHACPVRRHAYNGDAQFADCLRSVVAASESTHLLLVGDDIALTEPVDLQVCVQALEQTGAYGFYLLLENNALQVACVRDALVVPPLVTITEQICAWQFLCGEHDWRRQWSSVALYRTTAIKEQLARLRFSSLEEFIRAANAQVFDMHAIGVCFKKAKIAIPK